MRFERIATTAGSVPSVRGPTITLPTAGPSPNRSPSRARRPGRVASDRASTVRLQVLDLVAPWVVGLATLAARLATAATGPTDWDSAQYASAVTHFDVNHGRPQPPGYWLYVEAGRLVHGAEPGSVESLVLVSALASALAAGLVVVAGRDLGGRWVGLAAGVLIAASPFAWFSGSTVATYSFDLAVAPLLIILAWRARPRSWHGAGALAVLGLATGFRQSVLLMFGLLALVAVAGSTRRVRDALVAVAAGAVAVAAWFVPMALAQPGGAQMSSQATRAESRGALLSTSVLDHAVGGAGNLGTFAAYTTMALLPLAVLALVAAAGLGVRSLAHRTHCPGNATGAGSPAASLGRLDAPMVPDPDVHPGGRHRPPDGHRGPGRIRQGGLPPGLSARRGDRPAPGARRAAPRHAVPHRCPHPPVGRRRGVGRGGLSGGGRHRRGRRRPVPHRVGRPARPDALRTTGPVADPGPLPGPVVRHPGGHPLGRFHGRRARQARPRRRPPPGRDRDRLGRRGVRLLPQRRVVAAGPPGRPDRAR